MDNATNPVASGFESVRASDEVGTRHVAALLESLESPDGKLVCLYLALVEEARPSEIKETLGLNLLTIYPLLDGLIERGLVVRDGRRYRARLSE
ncbi:MAG: TrmB family transcriptional regulator [Haloferacaceae archaeon]